MTTASPKKNFIYNAADLTPGQASYVHTENRDSEMMVHRIDGQNSSLFHIRRLFNGAGIATISIQLTPTDLRAVAAALLNVADHIDANPVQGQP